MKRLILHILAVVFGALPLTMMLFVSTDVNFADYDQNTLIWYFVFLYVLLSCVGLCFVFVVNADR